MTCHLYPDLGVVLLLSFKPDVNYAKNIIVLSTSMAALVMLLKKANSLLFSILQVFSQWNIFASEQIQEKQGLQLY